MARFFYDCVLLKIYQKAELNMTDHTASLTQIKTSILNKERKASFPGFYDGDVKALQTLAEELGIGFINISMAGNDYHALTGSVPVEILAEIQESDEPMELPGDTARCITRSDGHTVLEFLEHDGSVVMEYSPEPCVVKLPVEERDGTCGIVVVSDLAMDQLRGFDRAILTALKTSRKIPRISYILPDAWYLVYIEAK